VTAPQDPFSTPPPERQAGASGAGDPQFGAPPPPYQPYGAPPFGTPGYSGAPKNGLGVAALVLGILGVMSSLLVFGALLGVVAIVLGFLGRRRAKNGEATNGGSALAGVILGLLSLVVAAVVVVAFANVFGDQFSTFAECDAQAETQAERAQCQIDFENDLTR